MAQKHDITADDRWFTNSDYAIDCYIKQSDLTTAQDVSSWAFSWLLKRNASDADANAILTKTSGAGITIVDGPAGHVQILIGAGDTDGTVKDRMYVHELKRTDSGFEVPVITGLARLRRSAHIT